MNIPEEVKNIYQILQEKGFEIYLVGGCVRNLILKRDVKDWDMTTNATPNDLVSLFPNSFYDNKFGTVGIPTKIDNKEQVVEITTFRTEEGYSDNRRPDKVSWGETIEEDLGRRDFTINAIALKIPSEIIDPYNGQEDLEKKLVKCVGNPNERFKEDALRLIRGIRLATELNFNIEEKTFEAIKNDASLLSHVSKERLRTELLRILKSERAYEGVLLLYETGLLEYILPELLEGVNLSQQRPGRHHKTDVFTHNVLSLKFCPSPDPIVKFATLIHDVGKPRVAAKDKNGLIIFHNHEIVGAKMAEIICDRLKFSKKEKDKIVTLIRWHMFSVDEHQTDSAIRRFIRRVGVENAKDIMDLRVGDRLGSGTQTAESWRLKLYKERIEKQLQPAPFSINDLVVDGTDIMKILDIKPGKKVGEILQKLFEEVDEDLSKNTREYLEERIKEI